MPSFSKVQVMGHMGRDVQFKDITNGRMARFSVAVTHMKETNWINIIAFGKDAEWIEKTGACKGDLVLVEGRIKTGSYDKEGVKHATFDIVASQFYNLSYKRKDDAAEEVEAGGDDLPF